MRSPLLAASMLCLAMLAQSSFAQVTSQLPAAAATTESPANIVAVQNNRNAVVTVYLATGKITHRLGTVPPATLATLVLPDWAMRSRSSFRLVARPADVPLELTSEEFKLDAAGLGGGRIGMRVPSGAEADVNAGSETMMASLAPEDLAKATVTVDNPRDVPVSVFATQGAFDVRLGEVAPKSRATLSFPESLLSPFGSLTLRVRPAGGLNLASQTLQVRAGQHLGLRVPAF